MATKATKALTKEHAIEELDGTNTQDEIWHKGDKL